MRTSRGRVVTDLGYKHLGLENANKTTNRYFNTHFYGLFNIIKIFQKLFIRHVDILMFCFIYIYISKLLWIFILYPN